MIAERPRDGAAPGAIIGGGGGRQLSGGGGAVTGGGGGGGSWGAFDEMDSFQLSETGVVALGVSSPPSPPLFAGAGASSAEQSLLALPSRSPLPPIRVPVRERSREHGRDRSPSGSDTFAVGPVVELPLAVGLADGSFSTDPDLADADTARCCSLDAGNAALTALADAFTSNAALSAGGDDDVIGQRLSLALPYPGLPFSSAAVPRTLYWALSDVWCCGIRLPCLSTHAVPRARARFDGGRRRPDQRPAAAEPAPVDVSPFMQRVIAAAATEAASMAGAAARGRQDGEDGDRGSDGDGDVGAGASSSGGEGSADEEEGGGASASAGGSGPRRRSSSLDSGDSGGGGRPRLSASARALARAAGPGATAALAAAAPPRWLWSAGITPCNVFAVAALGGPASEGLFAAATAAACRGAQRGCFCASRIMRRSSPPLAPSRRWAFFAAAGLHIVLMLVEISLTMVIVAQLFCVPPDSDISGAGSRGGAGSASQSGGAPALSSLFVVGECSFASLVLFLALPPLAGLLSPLLGLLAVAGGSSRALRTYAAWNHLSGAAICAVALALIAADARQLGLQSAVEPCVLLLAKVLAAQCVPVQLATLEAARPVRGWRGLHEVRTGPLEKGRRLELR
jgi:hypothetical protein